MTSRIRFAALTFAVLLLVASCGDKSTDDTEPSSTSAGSSTSGATPDTRAGEGHGAPQPALELTATVVAEMDQPIALITRPGDDALWLAERPGTIRRLEKSEDGSLVPLGKQVLDISDQTSTDAERGLLGIAFSVDGSTLYVSHTDPDGTSKVAAYSATDDGVDASTRQELLSIEQPFPNHNGGHLVVAEDDALYLGLGDGGAADDPENRAQDPETLLGKLVKVDTSGGEDHEIVASGLRNPWRFSFEPDGSVWIADVGQFAIEEINRISVGDLQGSNFGWSGYEGNEPYLDGDGRRPADPVIPVFTYTHDEGNCSITGGFVYQGTDLGLEGAYLFADYCGGALEAIWVDDAGEVTDHRELGIEVEGPVSFGTDNDASAYVLSAEGPVVRIEVAAPTP